MSEGASFKGLELELHRFSGARVLRVVHPGAQLIEEHEHDWAYIGLHTTGRYIERYDGGEADMWGPCAVLHPPGRPHADLVDEIGLETIAIEFDSAWLPLHGFAGKLDRSRVWSGGRIGVASRRLAAVLASPSLNQERLGSATAHFVAHALAADPWRSPEWVRRARDWMLQDRLVSTAELAQRLRLHHAYLAQTYRQAIGEGIGETLRRRRVETASAMLRNTALPLVEIALEAGFCDQSHMNRCFFAVLGRTPLRVRRERRLFEQRMQRA